MPLGLGYGPEERRPRPEPHRAPAIGLGDEMLSRFRAMRDDPKGLYGESAGDFMPGASVLDRVAMATMPVPIIGDAIGLAADVQRYATEPESRTLGNYALTGLGALPFVPAMAGIFAGAKAKNAPLEMLEQAKALDAAGEAPEGIWSQTGWFRGADGEWRWEIDDSKAKFKASFEREDPESAIMRLTPSDYLGRNFQHPQAYKAHPDLKKVWANDISYEPGGMSRGSYTEGTPATEKYFGRDPEITAKGESKDDARSILLHEMQHATQGAEGFARGGGPSDFPDMRVSLENETVWSNNAAKKLQEAIDRGRDGAVIRNAEGSLEVIEGRDALLDRLNQLTARLAQIEPEYEATHPFKQYQRLAGEVEARAVQARRDLTPEQRAARAPWQDYDVPVEQQIVRRGGIGLGGGPQMAMTKGHDPAVTEKALRHFGRTFNPREVGYILPEGQMLDFSGRHATDEFAQNKTGKWEPLPGKNDYFRDIRGVDHREVYDIVGEGGSEKSMREFMSKASAVRAIPTEGGVYFDTAGMPEPRQIEEMVKAHRRVSPREPMFLDVYNEQTGDILKSGLIERPTVESVEKYLREAYEGIGIGR